MKIAFLTSGGNAPCLNSSIGRLLFNFSRIDNEIHAIGYLNGFAGLLNSSSIDLPTKFSSNEIDAFYDFIVNELGAFTAREMYLAAICFSGRAGALVNVCKGTKYSKALRSMSATSWDLFLLRCPEIIAGTDKNDLPLGYVCTAEKKLADFAKLTSIKRLQYKNGDMSPPLLSLDLGSKDDKKTTIINDQIHHRHKNRESPFRDISDSDLNLLIKQLEHEIKNLCG